MKKDGISVEKGNNEPKQKQEPGENDESMFDLIVGTHFESEFDEVQEVGGDTDFLLPEEEWEKNEQ